MTSVAVRGGRVVLADHLRIADVIVVDGRIDDLVGPGEGLGDVVVDASGLLVAPGFVDVQCNGAFGVDLSSDPEGMVAMSRALPRHGVTSFLPTIVTGPEATRLAARDVLASHAAWPGAEPLGLHLEGPLIAPSRRGAHPAAHIAAPGDVDTAWWTPDEGVVLVTIAPELEGAHDVVAALAGRGVAVSIGHSDATRAEVRAATDAGATMVTHLFNAMSPLSHREPGMVGSSLIDDRLRCGVIVDGVHVDPDIVALAWQVLGPKRLVLVTDSVAAAGAGPGADRLGVVETLVTAGATRTIDGTLAGSLLTMDRAVRNLVAFAGCSLVDAVRAATRNPADVLGRSELGRIERGARADLVLLDESVTVHGGLIGGRPFSV